MLRWNLGEKDYKDYHIYVSVNDSSSAYMGNTGIADQKIFEWKEGTPRLANEYKNGPQFDNRYQFTIFGIGMDGTNESITSNEDILFLGMDDPVPSNTPGQPTPINTPDRPNPTNTPISELPTPTKSPDQQLPLVVYEFGSETMELNGWGEIPGGFGGANPGVINTFSFVSNHIPSSQDKIGIELSVERNEISFIHALDTVNTGGDPILMRMRFNSSSPHAAVALVALKGNLLMGTADGSIATHIPANASSFVDKEGQLVLLYEPDSGEEITPVIQVAGTGNPDSASVRIDSLEIYKIDSSRIYPGDFFSSSYTGLHPDGNSTPNSQPDMVFEFDKDTLENSGWAEIPGGFTGAVPGMITTLSYVGQHIPSSNDNVGIAVTVNPKEVAFIHSLSTIQTNGKPVMLKMLLRSSSPDAAIALVALKGSIAGGTVDGSLATHIPANASLFVDNDGMMVLLYEPDSGNEITPVIQVAATGQEGPVTVRIDRLETYILDPDQAYEGNLFNSVLSQ